ncbi:hypothetical protein BS17DRAFT_782831 [Gyrodon lividus]|nr:hypothetical protein BS17DRAFT_782831 [Gyrodon lividus]
MSSQRDAEFDNLINGAIQRSIKSFSLLAAHASDEKCIPSQYQRMVAVMYYQLDANKIPREERPEDFLPEKFEIPFICLAGLGVTLPVWLSHAEISTKLLKGLIHHWDDIRQWILFLYQAIIVQKDIDLDLRLNCKSAVLEFLGLVRDRLVLSWSQMITTDREVMRLICDLWYLETRDARFFTWSLNGTNQRESAVFNSCFLVSHEMRTTIDWENILCTFNSDTELIASIALRHLDREISQGTLDLNCIGWDMHIISAFSFRENIRLSLLRQGAIKAAVDVLALIVSQSWTGDKRIVAARCMANATVFLKIRLEDMDGIPFILQALKSNLIPSLLKCESLLPFTDNMPASRQPEILLGSLVQSYTIYRSVLRPISLSIDKVEKTRVEANLVIGSQLHKTWMRLKESVAERRRLMKHDIADGHHIQTCQNDKCSQAGETGTFKRCGGCLHAFYCSKACQRYDWQYGKHKSYCKMVHQRCFHTRGQMSSVKSKDLRFLDQIFISELRKYPMRINTRSPKINVVELNFVGGFVNISFDSNRANPNPFGIKCPCEKFANARWKKEIEKAKAAKEPLVLVRAFIPGGMSRKIVLQAIPLRRILGKEDHRRGDRVESASNHLNLIYTCCGQESLKRDLESLRG